MLLRPGRSGQGDSAIVHELSNFEAFDYDLQPFVEIRPLGYLKRVLDHMNLRALGIYGRVVPPGLSAFFDREDELVFWVEFPKILLHGTESQRARRRRVHGGFRMMPKPPGLFQRYTQVRPDKLWAKPTLNPLCGGDFRGSILATARAIARLHLVSFLDCITEGNPANV
jgi:hypothetical protein